MRAPDRGASLRVATYNIHGGRGMDFVYDLGRIKDVIREIDADVVALQEVDNRRHPGGVRSQLDEIASDLGYEPVDCPTISEANGHYGNAVLSRYPVTRSSILNLSVEGKEPRAALDVELDIGSRRVRIVNTHLGLSHAERLWQTRRVLSHLREAADRESAVGMDGAGDLRPAERFGGWGNPGSGGVLLGDFNWWRPGNKGIRLIESALAAVPAHRTYPARLPLLSLDRVWAFGDARIAGTLRHETALSRVASDHMPLVAELCEA